jgi:hypothetical protein
MCGYSFVRTQASVSKLDRRAPASLLKIAGLPPPDASRQQNTLASPIFSKAAASPSIALEAALLEGDTYVRQNGFKFAGLLRPTRFKLAVLLAAALIGGSAGLPGIHTLLSRPPGAHWTAEQATRRMLMLCDAYKGPCAMDEMPTYYGDIWVSIPQHLCRRSVWVGFVHVDGQLLELIVNERTGNLVYIFHGGEAEATTDGPRMNARVETPAQAARLSMLAVRKLQMIPRDARVALAGVPAVDTKAKAWQVTWQVWQEPMTAPYPVKVVLQQHDGRLMVATNVREQSVYSTR